MTEKEIMGYFLEKFGHNVPIFLEEIDSSIANQFFVEIARSLISKGWIEEYSKNVYYIPTTTALGKSTLNPNIVCEKKYMRNKVDVFGYYTGVKLLNLMGLTTQVPNIIQIATNKCNEEVHLIKEGSMLIELKKPATKVTKENADTLQFLEAIAMLFITNYSLKKDNEVIMIFKTYIANHLVTRKSVLNNISYYPEYVRKELLESDLIDELAD